jgi:iron complex outermembrane receptor protein
LDLTAKNGFSLKTSFRTMGRIPLNDANTKYRRYALLDIKSSYVFALAKVLQIELHAGLIMH